MCTNASKRILITMIASLIMDIKKYIYKVVIQEGALQNLVVSVKARLCRELNGWAGIWQNTAGPISPSGQEVTGRLQPHATNSTWALLPKLLSSSRALPEAWQQGIIPAVSQLLPGSFGPLTITAISPFCWRTCSLSVLHPHSRGCITAKWISIPNRAMGLHTCAETGLPQGGSALHAQSPESQCKMQSQERQCSTWRSE